MRLQKYLDISDSSTALFRSLNINLVEKPDDMVTNTTNQVEESIDLLLKRANKSLKSVYRGKMVFGLCSEDQGLNPDDVTMMESKRSVVKEMWYELNDELSTIQSNFESYLSNLK